MDIKMCFKKGWNILKGSIDNYDISIEKLDKIQDKTILKEEYKHTLSRMLNFEKFMKEKILLLSISSVGVILAFGLNKIIETEDTKYFDLILYGLSGLLLSLMFFLIITNKINTDLKSRKDKIINLLQGDLGSELEF
jgi:hypothetical protein